MIVGVLDAPDVIAVVPTLGRDPERLTRCFAALRNQRTSLRLAIVCVMNTRIGDGPDVDTGTLSGEVAYLHPGVNLGWGGGLNLGIRSFDATHYWLVQDDVVADEDCLEQLYHALDSGDDLALVSPVVVDANGFVPAGQLGGMVDASGHITTWLPRETCDVEAAVIDYAPSYVAMRGALLARSTWNEVDGFDGRFYPLIWTDVDLCHSLTQRGYSFSTIPTAFVQHSANASYSSAYGDFLFKLNGDRFREKWFPGGRLLDKPAAFRPVTAVPADLLNVVASSASDTLSHLALAFAELRRGNELISREHRAQERRAEIAENHSRNLTSELTRHTSTIEGMREHIAELTAEVERTRLERNHVHASHSWKVSAPLRALRKWFGRMQGRR